MLAIRGLTIATLLLSSLARAAAGERQASPVNGLIAYGFPVMPPDQQTAVFSLTAKILRQDLTWAPDRIKAANGDFISRADAIGGLTPEMRQVAQENPILAPLLREFERGGVKPSNPDILGLNVTEIRVLHQYWKCFDTEPTRDFVAKIADSANVDEIIDYLDLDLPSGKRLRDFKVSYFLEVLTEHDGCKCQGLALVAADSLSAGGRANLSAEQKEFIGLRPGVFGSIDENKIRARRAARARLEQVTAEGDRLERYREMVHQQGEFFQAQIELLRQQKQDTESRLGFLPPHQLDRLLQLSKKLDYAVAHPGSGKLTQSEIHDLQAHPDIFADRLGQLALQRIDEASRQSSAEQRQPTGGATATAQTNADSERAARAKLKIAKQYLHDNNLEKAKKKLEELIAEFPTTKAASDAKKLLEELVR